DRPQTQNYQVSIAFIGEMSMVTRMADGEKPAYHILVVDDDPSVGRAIELMLQCYGHQVQTANDGHTALSLFETGNFDLVITDYLMPEMKGDQLIVELKRRRPGQRVILATAFADDFIAHGKSACGVDHVLAKPFSLAELQSAIRKVMSGSGAEI
ncbi:MAG TPA: response regulator, partial [Verrucomicrobiae bacterium]